MSIFWTILITLGILQLSTLATTIYLHRTITHRGLELHPAAAFLMHLELFIFTGVSPRHWAAVHRKHHHFSDQEGDPHSPRLLGLWKVLLGNYHYYKKEASNPETVRKYTPDYKPDAIDRLGIKHGELLGLGIFLLMFGWVWGAVAWLIHVVLYLTINAMINGLGHVVGYRNYQNEATNLQWLAWISSGEGLHNNHHEYPSSARFSMRRGEVDLAWPVILLLEKTGLAKVKPQPIAKAA